MKGPTFTIENFGYTIYFERGRVAGKDKHVETQVYGGGGGGYSYQGTGASGQVSISSTTTVHDKIYLDLGNGKRHDLELVNWDISCLEGDDLMIIWIIKDGNETGKYVAIKNFNSGKLAIKNMAIESLAGIKHTSFIANHADLGLIIFFSILGVIWWFSYTIGLDWYLLPVAIVIWIVYLVNKNKTKRNRANTIKAELTKFIDKQE